MPQYNVYKDIAERTGGSVYFGVVGPVRTGKSTLISKMTETLLLPNIKDGFVKQRITDEMPQSGNGITIMTTQPRFVPDTAVSISIDDIAELQVRMVDCVGYLIDGVQGHLEDDKPRMVKTPWYDHDIPFEAAAELGTEKVITDHSTIGIVVTTDGSFTGIPRNNYEEAEEKTVNKLKKLGKPFIIVLNSSDPQSEAAAALQAELKNKYKVNVVLCDILNFRKEDMLSLLSDILYEFPLQCIDLSLPKWIPSLGKEHYILKDIIEKANDATRELKIMRDYERIAPALERSEYVLLSEINNINLGSGTVSADIKLDENLFYKVLSEECGYEIDDEKKLFSVTKELVDAKEQYDKLKNAIASVKQSGYGIVSPSCNDISVTKPELYESGGKYGISIKAFAPTLHLVRVDVETEINPIIGNQAAAEEFLSDVLSKYDMDASSIWDIDIFGKKLPEIVSDSFKAKVGNIPDNARDKLQSTLERVVNEGSGGILFILL